MKIIRVDSAWHNAEVAALMYSHVMETGEPCTAKVNDVRIVMFPEDARLKDHTDRPKWEDRPEITTL